MKKNIAGHQHIISLLQKSLEKKHAHAFLFAGDSHIGKTAVSDFVIDFLIPHDFQKLNVLDLRCEEDKLVISIEQIIEMQKQIVLKPTNKYPIVVRINEPELLSDEAANRILKILEEPPEYVIFILITSNEHLVMDTIKSRCQKINFQNVSDDDIREFVLENNGSIPSNFDNILQFAHGCPGKVMRAIEDPEYFDNYIQDLKSVIAMLDKPSVEQLQIIQEWFSSRKSYIEKKKKLEYTLSLLEELLHGIIALQNNEKGILNDASLEKIAKKLSHRNIIDLFNVLTEHARKLKFNPDIQTMAHHITLLSTHK